MDTKTILMKNTEHIEFEDVHKINLKICVLGDLLKKTFSPYNFDYFYTK